MQEAYGTKKKKRLTRILHLIRKPRSGTLIQKSSIIGPILKKKVQKGILMVYDGEFFKKFDSK